jgi:hypothetical protein
LFAALQRLGWKHFFDSILVIASEGLESLAEGDYRPDGDVEEFLKHHRHLLGTADFA